MLRVHQIKLSLDHSPQDLERQLRKKLALRENEPFSYRMIRESTDLRKGQPLKVVYSVEVETPAEGRILKKIPKDVERVLPERAFDPRATAFEQTSLRPLTGQPVIVGFGPAGMFAGELLSRYGMKPLIIERGSRVDKRAEAIERFWADGILDPESNVQFGEGGAGTFSDGKLTSRSKDARGQQVLDLLADLGAPEDIRYRQKPHVGTDLLRVVVPKMRSRIEAQGGQFLFDTRLEDLEKLPEGGYALKLSDGQVIKTPVVILAIGHSARDTFSMLRDRGLAMAAKPFAVGVRIEHRQAVIDAQQYGEHLEPLRARYGAAEYRMTATTASGRGVYTFCMCPGGEVVAAASEPQGVVTNGMSERARAGENANSALLVSVLPGDFDSEDVLAGVEFQRTLERGAYELGGQTYRAPYMRVGEFLGEEAFDSSSGFKSVRPTYRPAPIKADFRPAMPPFLLAALQEGLRLMGEKVKPFADGDAILTAFETRSSSPVRLIRSEVTLESVSHPGLYPCGEGAGYAGGITSSAIDGIKVAEKILTHWLP